VTCAGAAQRGDLDQLACVFSVLTETPDTSDSRILAMEEAKQLRGIVAKRLSHMTEATTHLVTEAESTQDYCHRKNILIVAETEDLDVSGGMPIRERPGVGPWLTLDRLDDWDVLVLYKLDRGFRNHLDFVTFYHEFYEVHGKQIVSVTQNIDMTTRHGKFFANQLVQFAEWELLEMSQRRSEAAKVIRRAARWGGGSFTFGYEPYRAEEGDRKVWYLRKHPVYGGETVRMALLLLSGKSAGSIAASLNERGIPTARDVQNQFSGKPVKGYKWTTHAVVAWKAETMKSWGLGSANPDGEEGQPPEDTDS
jgi:DNA invertase Pin-like site-specific DNA recombinase